MLMLADGYVQVRSNRVRGTELAFWTRSVVAALQSSRGSWGDGAHATPRDAVRTDRRLHAGARRYDPRLRDARR